MKRLIAFFLLCACAAAASADRMDGMKFGYAMGKAGYGVEAIRAIGSSIENANAMAASGNHRSAAGTSALIIEQLDHIYEVKSTKVYGQLLISTSQHFHNAGLGSSALYYGLRAEEFWRTKYPKDEERVQATVNLVVYYNTERDSPKARQWIEKSLALTAGKKKYREYETELWNNEALLAFHEGDFAEAIRIGELVAQSSPTPVHKQNLITYYEADGRYDRVIELRRATLADCAPGTMEEAEALNSLAAALYDSGLADMTEPLALSLRAESLYKSNKRTLSPAFITLLDNIAAYYDRAGDTAQAIAYSRRAENIIGNLEGNANFSLATRNCKQLAALLFKSGDYAGAADAAIRFCATDMPNTVYTMVSSKKDVRSRVWSGSSGWYLEFMPLLALKSDNDSIATLAYDALLLGKGILLNAEKSVAAYAECGNDDTRRLYADWQQALAQAAEAKLPDEITATQQRSREAEQRLMNALFELPELRREFACDWREIAAKLHPDEAAMEITTVIMPDSSRTYVAAVITPWCLWPAVKQLCTADEMDDMLADSLWNPAIAGALWEPVRNTLTGVKRLYFAPAGDLHFIPLETIGGLDGTELVRLTSTRELLRLGTRAIAADGSNAALFGGIDYGRYPPAAPADSTVAPRTYRSAMRTLRDGDVVLDSLPGTLREVHEIAGIIGAQRVFTGSAGSEQALRSLSGSALRTLHIGTHGFYLDGGGKADASGDEALSRAGLFLAGATRTLNGESDAHADADGVVTAAEIAEMQFPALDLVVLSACETALGDVSGEGVFGLQRGFKKAGAGAMLMSLWKVDDKATTLLMTEFFRALKAGTPAAEALRAAQSAVRRQWPSPEYSDAFILIDGI